MFCVDQKKIVFSKKLENIYRDNDIQPLCAPLFSRVKGINSFEYTCCYKEGGGIAISTCSEYIKNVCEEGLYISTDDLEKVNQIHGFQKRLYGFFCKEIAITDSLKSKDIYRLNITLGETLGIEKSFFIIKKEKDHTALVSIGTNQVKGIQDFMNLCSGNLQIFNSFIDYFKDVGREIINVFKSEMIVPSYKLECKQENKKLRFHNFKTSNSFYLTPREYECLESMTLGRSVKETSHLLNLSPRTVEAYINRAKLKTGFNGRSQLVSFFMNLK